MHKTGENNEITATMHIKLTATMHIMYAEKCTKSDRRKSIFILKLFFI